VPKGGSPTAAELRQRVVATTSAFVEGLVRDRGIPA
jgi:hypothetical protein